MKKIILTTCLLLIFTSVASASSLNGDYNGKPIVRVITNGQEIIPSGTPAYVDDGSTMVPISILRELGFTVSWDQSTYTVTVTPPDPVIVIQEVENPMEPVTEPEASQTLESPTESAEVITDGEVVEPTPSASPEPTPTPDNTAACDAIRKEYEVKIVMTGYQGYSMGKMKMEVLLLEYERDQKLIAAGC